MPINTWLEQEILISGSEGLLESKLGQHIHDQSDNKGRPVRSGFIMCHPHPLYSGTMDNKVVTTLVRGISRLSTTCASDKLMTFDTLRFNFRGVGKSAGVHDYGKGEIADLTAIVDYAQKELGWEQIYLAGFSFGAGIACLYAERHPECISGLFLVAPAVHHFDAPSVMPFDFETYVYMGDSDEVVPFDEVEHWVNLLTPQPHFHIFQGASHFFHGRLIDLKGVFLEDFSACVNETLG